MRRINVIVVTCFCVLTGCTGGDAAEPYGGSLMGSRRAAAAAPAAQAPEAELIASAVDVPWAIALLSDNTSPAAKRPRRPMVVRRDPVVVEPLAGWGNADLELVLEEDHAYARPTADEKPGAAKTCSGVVNRRS